MPQPAEQKQLSRGDLKKLAGERLRDAEVLFAGGRYDAAAYTCGYVIEMALKACVCRRLGETEYPQTDLGGKFKTHSYEDLLLLAGLRRHKPTNWSKVADWLPDWRYKRPGTTRQDAEDRIRLLRSEILPWLKRRW